MSSRAPVRVSGPLAEFAPDLPEQGFRSTKRSWPPLAAVRSPRGGVSVRSAPGGGSSRDGLSRKYSCPNPGCDKVYRGSRGGWDSHVGSLRIHPSWHPELHDEADRKQRYRLEFPDFFR
jgi:hypothetical protein